MVQDRAILTMADQQLYMIGTICRDLVRPITHISGSRQYSIDAEYIVNGKRYTHLCLKCSRERSDDYNLYTHLCLQ